MKHATRQASAKGLLMGLVAATALYAPGAFAEEADDAAEFSVVTSMRAWSADWTTFVTFDTDSNGLQDQKRTSTTSKIVYSPSAQLRYGDFAVSGGAMLEGKFDFNDDEALQIGVADRSELDVSFQYYPLPALSVSAGYKKIDQDFGGAKYNWDGYTLGFSGSLQLEPESNFLFYGSFVTGFLKADSTDSAVDGKNAVYVQVEPGLGYFWAIGNTYLTTTLGYRFQTVNTKGVAFENGKSSVRDVTQGIAAGLSLRFGL